MLVADIDLSEDLVCKIGIFAELLSLVILEHQQVMTRLRLDDAVHGPVKNPASGLFGDFVHSCLHMRFRRLFSRKIQQLAFSVGKLDIRAFTQIINDPDHVSALIPVQARQIGNNNLIFFSDLKLVHAQDPALIIHGDELIKAAPDQHQLSGGIQLIDCGKEAFACPVYREIVRNVPGHRLRQSVELFECGCADPADHGHIRPDPRDNCLVKTLFKLPAQFGCPFRIRPDLCLQHFHHLRGSLGNVADASLFDVVDNRSPVFLQIEHEIRKHLKKHGEYKHRVSVL